MREISTDTVPGAVPGLFSNAVEIDGIVYISGMHAGGETVPEDIGEQARIALKRVTSLAEAAGGARIVKITVFVTDMSEKAAVGAARREIFNQPPLPAATLVEVSGFIDPRLKIEVEAVAHLPR